MFRLLRNIPTLIFYGTMFCCVIIITESVVGSILAIFLETWMQALDFSLWSNIVTLAWTDLYLLLLCNSSTQVFGWCLSCPTVWSMFYPIKAIVGKSVNIFLAYCCAYRLDYAPLRRMYGLRTVFLECCQLVWPPNWLSSLYGLPVKKKIDHLWHTEAKILKVTSGQFQT